MNSTTIIIGFLVLIIIALFSGLFFLISDDGSKKRTLRALSIRIGLSVALILFLVVGFLSGWIKPHGIMP
jgi:Na+-driven multidrug efflux pump